MQQRRLIFFSTLRQAVSSCTVFIVQPGIDVPVTDVMNFGYHCDNAGCAHDVVIS